MPPPLDPDVDQSEHQDTEQEEQELQAALVAIRAAKAEVAEKTQSNAGAVVEHSDEQKESEEREETEEIENTEDREEAEEDEEVDGVDTTQELDDADYVWDIVTPRLSYEEVIAELELQEAELTERKLESTALALDAQEAEEAFYDVFTEVHPIDLEEHRTEEQLVTDFQELKQELDDLVAANLIAEGGFLTPEVLALELDSSELQADTHQPEFDSCPTVQPSFDESDILEATSASTTQVLLVQPSIDQEVLFATTVEQVVEQVQPDLPDVEQLLRAQVSQQEFQELLHQINRELFAAQSGLPTSDLIEVPEDEDTLPSIYSVVENTQQVPLAEERAIFEELRMRERNSAIPVPMEDIAPAFYELHAGLDTYVEPEVMSLEDREELEEAGDFVHLVDLDHLSLNQQEEVLEWLTILQLEQDEREVAPLYERMQTLSVTDFEVFENEILFQEYVSQVTSVSMSSETTEEVLTTLSTCPQIYFPELAFNEYSRDFLTHATDGDTSAVTQVLLQLNAPRLLDQLHIQISESLQVILDPYLEVIQSNSSDKDFKSTFSNPSSPSPQERQVGVQFVLPTLVPPEPPPYNFQEELEVLTAQDLDSTSSNDIVRSFQNAREVQLRAITNFRPASAAIVDASPPSQESKCFSLTNPSMTRGVVKEQLEAIQVLQSLEGYKIHPSQPTVRMYTFTANTPQEMIDFFLDKEQGLGTFTKHSDVIKKNKRNLSRCVSTDPNWGPFAKIIKLQQVRKQILKQDRQITWVVYNRHQGSRETGKQRLNFTIDMTLLDVYHAELKTHAAKLAQDTEQTRVMLYKLKEANPIFYQPTLKFWKEQGYTPPKIYPVSSKLDSPQVQSAQISSVRTKVESQKDWTFTNQALEGKIIFCQALGAGQLVNHQFGKQVLEWKTQHKARIQTSAIRLLDGGKPMTLQQLLSQSDEKLTNVNCLNEKKGATEVFELHLKRIVNPQSPNNLLKKYLSLKLAQNEPLLIESSWGVQGEKKGIGVDKYDQKFRVTFAPDIIIKDMNGFVKAVIDLKGLSQFRRDLLATSSMFQIIELMKYHVEHDVPVAFVILTKEGTGVVYEWVVIGRADIAPPRWMMDLLDKLDPLLPRTARSQDFVKALYYHIKRDEETSFKWNHPIADSFRDMVDSAQKEFENLGFYKKVTKIIDVKTYWNYLTEKAKERGLTSIEGLTFQEFYYKWKTMGMEIYGEKLIDWYNHYRENGLDD